MLMTKTVRLPAPTKFHPLSQQKSDHPPTPDHKTLVHFLASCQEEKHGWDKKMVFFYLNAIFGEQSTKINIKSSMVLTITEEI